METSYSKQNRGDSEEYAQYLEAMDTISIEKVASASVFFEPREGNVIVDVGMASGTSTAILSKLFPKLDIVGVDINPTMVQIANETYEQANLSFREDDGEYLRSFDKNSVNGFFNCSTIHHITSYNGYDSNRAFNALKRQVELLKDRGVLIVRDFLKPEEKEVVVEFSAVAIEEGKPSDADLFIVFSKTARSLAVDKERGFPIQELPSTQTGTRRFKAFFTDVTEFIRRKDYLDNWDVELQEEYGYFTKKEFEDAFRELGLRIIISSPIYNQWIINNRYKNKFKIYDLSGQEIGYPPTNYLIAGEKIVSGKQIQLIRHLPTIENSFLKYASYKNVDSGEIWDIVHRPNKVLDIIPYIKREDGISILAKHGYPRALATIRSSSPIIDNKEYSGYITEGISLAYNDDIFAALEGNFGIVKKDTVAVADSLCYYTSPGGIDEKVEAKFIVLKSDFTVSFDMNKVPSGFKDSGYIHVYDAVQLLNTAQTGALLEARLELNIYNLFFKEAIALPNWLGEKITIKAVDAIKSVSLLTLLNIVKSEYVYHDTSADFLTTNRALFGEIGIDNSHSILEYVHPTDMSFNTLLTLPIVSCADQLYVGIEMRSLPVPQIHTQNSMILTVPAVRMPRKVDSMYHLEQFIAGHSIGNSRLESYAKLGEKYFPSIGVTPEQVYPFVVSLSDVDDTLAWVSLTELYHHMDKINDAHLLVAIFRLMHMVDFRKR